MGRELGQPGLKPTVRVGEAALREVAAFLLDHGSFAKVRSLALILQVMCLLWPESIAAFSCGAMLHRVVYRMML